MPTPHPDRDPRLTPGVQRLESSGFVWPPLVPQNPDDAERPTTPPPAGAATHSIPPMKQASLRGDAELHAHMKAALRPNSSKVAMVVHACEREFLDLTIPPLARRAAGAGWFPDLPGVYCPRCGRSTREPTADALGCSKCLGSRPPFERIVRLGSYEDLLRRMVHEIKFDKRRTLGVQLGRLLGHALRRELERAGVAPESIVIVPMPTTFWRRMSRGIDHALVIARAVRSITGGRICRPISKRHRPSQLEVNPSERASNMARAFRPRRAAMPWNQPDLDGKVVIVIDDVTTTGATLRGACRAIAAAWRQRRPHGRRTALTRPRIWAAVLGVTPQAAEEAGPPHPPGLGSTSGT